jgi:hypothetical protein
MTMYEITCYTLEELVTVCAQLTKEGLCFTADTNTLKIKLTGGY